MSSARNNPHLEELGQLDRTLLGHGLDLKSPDVMRRTRVVADQILSRHTGQKELRRLEADAIGSGVSLSAQLAIKLALSKRALLRMGQPMLVSVVCPAYGETTRLLPRGDGPGQHPDGEDFVREKSAQLEWLFSGTRHDYNVTIVDDMSPEGPDNSGAAVQRVIDRYSVPKFTVASLRDAVRHESSRSGLVGAALRGLTIPKNSRKAGATLYGAARVIEAAPPGVAQVIVTTDCDLSTDLGQLGNLVTPLRRRGVVAAAGSRRSPTSVVETAAARTNRSIVMNYMRDVLFDGRLPIDTQAGAKAFRAPELAKVITDGVNNKDFAYEVEVLARLSVDNGRESVVAVPIAWFDSEALTTVNPSVQWKNMMDQVEIAEDVGTGVRLNFQDVVDICNVLSKDVKHWLAFLDAVPKDPQLMDSISRLAPAAAVPMAEIAVESAGRGKAHVIGK